MMLRGCPAMDDAEELQNLLGTSIRPSIVWEQSPPKGLGVGSNDDATSPMELLITGNFSGNRLLDGPAARRKGPGDCRRGRGNRASCSPVV